MYAVIHAPWARAEFTHGVSRTEKEVRMDDAMNADHAKTSFEEAKTSEQARLHEGSVSSIHRNG